MTRRFTFVGTALLLSASMALLGCGGDSNADDVRSAGSTPSSSTGESGSGEGSGPGSGEQEGERDGGAGSGGSAYAEAMAASMVDGDDAMPVTQDQADCVAERFVEVIGVDRFESAGITPEDLRDDDESLQFAPMGLSVDEGNELYDSFDSCGVDLRTAILESMADDDDLTAETRSCLEDVFTEANLRAFMVTSMIMDEEDVENDPAAAPVIGGLMACMMGSMGDFDVRDLDDLGA